MSGSPVWFSHLQHMHEHAGNAIHSPANGLTLVHWSTGVNTCCRNAGKEKTASK